MTEKNCPNAALERLHHHLPIQDQIRAGHRERETKFDPWTGLSSEQERALDEKLTSEIAQYRKRDWNDSQRAKRPRYLGSIVAHAQEGFLRSKSVFFSAGHSSKCGRSINRPGYFNTEPFVAYIIALRNEGYLKCEIVEKGLGKKASSIFIGTEKLDYLLKKLGFKLNNNRHISDRPAIILRDRDKIDKTFDLTPQISDWDANVRRYNEFHLPQRIELRHDCGNLEPLDPVLHRVFNEYFDKGGRFCGSDIQLLTGRGDGAERKRVLFNGNKTIELDFSGFQPRLLYQLAGTECPLDPYNIQELKELLGDFLSPSELGLIAKIAMVIMINRKNRRGIGSHKHKIDKLIHRVREEDIGVYYEEWFSLDKYDISMKTIFDMCEQHNSPISNALYSAKGLELMFIESEICNLILEEALNENIVICPVHDSFIVEECNEQWLRESMNRNYKKVTGYECIVK